MSHDTLMNRIAEHVPLTLLSGRCGQFAIRFDANSAPNAIRLLHAM